MSETLRVFAFSLERRIPHQEIPLSFAWAALRAHAGPGPAPWR